VIEVQSLTKRYGSHTAVQGLSFEVPAGQICGFLGPNGAGKSTTLRMLTGFLAPSEGRIRIAGVDALAHPIEARRNIGYMPEACPLYPEMRVAEYLRYRAELKGVPRRQIKSRVETSLEQATIADVSHRIIGQLSKGYRQRVGLADALLADPPLLVLDEPTAGLDPNQIRQVRDLVTALAKNKTVLLSTHILPEVEAICDRVLILSKGRLVSEGTPGSLRGRAAGREIIRFEGRGAEDAFRKALAKLAGVTVDELRTVQGEGARALVRGRLTVADGGEDVAEAVFQAIAGAGLVLRELRRQETSLEDVFAELTTKEPAAESTKPTGADEDTDDGEGEDDGDEGADPGDGSDEDGSDEAERGKS
jgi:ABC-2 type transport system ATP-binding protein